MLDENGINAAESLLIARTLMRPTVYFHHVSRIGECMFQIAMLDHMATHPPGVLSRSVHSMMRSACIHSNTPEVLLRVRWQTGSMGGGSTSGPSMQGRIRSMRRCSRPAGRLSDRGRLQETLPGCRVPGCRCACGHPPGSRGYVSGSPGQKPACPRGLCRVIPPASDAQPDPARAVAVRSVYAPGIPRCGSRCRSRDPAHKKAHPPGHAFLIGLRVPVMEYAKIPSGRIKNSNMRLFQHSLI